MQDRRSPYGISASPASNDNLHKGNHKPNSSTLIAPDDKISLEIEVTKSYILFFLQSFFYNQGGVMTAA